MSAVAPIVSGRVGEDATGAVFEYVPPNIAAAGGGTPGTTQLAGVFSANNGTLTLPAGYAILDIAALETGGVSGNVNIGTTSGGHEIVWGFSVNSNKFNLFVRSDISDSSVRFVSKTTAATLYINCGATWPAGLVIELTITLLKMIP